MVALCALVQHLCSVCERAGERWHQSGLDSIGVVGLLDLGENLLLQGLNVHFGLLHLFFCLPHGPFVGGGELEGETEPDGETVKRRCRCFLVSHTHGMGVACFEGEFEVLPRLDDAQLLLCECLLCECAYQVSTVGERALLEFLERGSGERYDGQDTVGDTCERLAAD